MVGPYVHADDLTLTDSDGDGYPEIRDPWGHLLVYHPFRTHDASDRVGGGSFFLGSPGQDGEIGGALDSCLGYVPSTTARGAKLERDNITNLGLP